MKYTELARWITQEPNRYRYFGVWWWSLKDVLRRDGFELGTNDNPAVRQRLSVLAPDDAAVVRAALREMRRNLGAYLDGSCQFPDGEAYYLHDADMDAPLPVLA